MKKSFYSILAVLSVFAMLAAGCSTDADDGPTGDPLGQVTVTFDADGGTPTPPAQTFASGGKATEPTGVTKANSTLDGWFNGETKWNFASDTVTASITLKAKWTANAAGTFTVTFNKNHSDAAGTFTEANPTQKPGGASGVGTLPTAPTRTGYTFSKWTAAQNGTGAEFTATTAVTAAITVYAQWTASSTTPTAVTLNTVTANGVADTTTTTQLTLTFDKAVAGLAAADITLTSTTGATRGSLSGSGPAYTLAISGVTQAGNVSVAVAKTGFAFTGSPKEVNIFFAPPDPNKNKITVEGTGMDQKLVHAYPGAPSLTVSSASPYSGVATINADGTVTIGAGTNNAGGALLYKFPTSETYDYKDYDIVTVEYVLADKIQGTGGTGNCEIALRTWGTRNAYGYGAPGYPDIMKASNNPLVFPVRGAGATEGFTWEHNSYQWATNNRYETYVIEITKITFSKVPHFTVTFDSGFDGGPEFDSRDYLENDPISRLGALPAPTRSGHTFDGWFEEGGEEAVAATTLVTADMDLTGKWTAGSLQTLEIDDPAFTGGGGVTGNATNGFTMSGGGHIIGFDFPSTLGSYATVTFTTNITNNDSSTPKLTIKNAKMAYSPDIASGQYKDLPTTGGEYEFSVAANLFTSGSVTFQHNGGNYTIKITKITLTPPDEE